MTDLRNPAGLARTGSSDCADAADDGDGVSRPLESSVPVAVDSPQVLPAYSRTLSRCPESARTARRLVTTSLQMWGLETVQDTAHLVVTELVSNAAKHAEKDTVLVTVTRRNDHVVRVAVVDLSEAMPVIRATNSDAVDGRGLALVAAMSEGHWGVEVMRWGSRGAKRVWADLETKS